MIWQQIRLLAAIAMIATLATVPIIAYSATVYGQNITEQILTLSNKTIDLCGANDEKCYNIEYEGTNLIIIEGDELIPNIAPGGPAYAENPEFWNKVDSFISQGFRIVSVFQLPYEEYVTEKAYRVILSK